MGGSPRKAAPIHQLHGNQSHHTDLDARDILPDPILPSPPDWLSRRGRAVWAELAPELDTNALLTKRDGMAFALMCEEAAMLQTVLLSMRTADNHYRVTEVDRSHQNRKRRMPEGHVYASLSKSFRDWSMRFGLTPKDRIGLMVGQVQRGSGDDTGDLVEYAG